MVLFESSSFSSFLVFPLSLVSAASRVETRSASAHLDELYQSLATYLCTPKFLLAKEPNLHKVGLIIDFVLTVSFFFSFLFFDVFERGLYCYGFSTCKITHLQFPLEIITGSLQLLSLMAFCSYPYNLIFTAEPTRRNMGTCRGRL